MRHAGRISNWNDEKGFGFVTPHDGGARAFVHVKAFQLAARRPVEGDLISYDTKADGKGRLNATAVRFAGQRIVTPAAARSSKASRRETGLPHHAAQAAIAALAAEGKLDGNDVAKAIAGRGRRQQAVSAAA